MIDRRIPPMAQISPQLFLLFLLITPSLSYFSTYSSYKALFSLSHSLLTRVSNLRASRGDISGAYRASALAKKLERGLGLGFWRMTWNLGLDYVRNYASTDFHSTDWYAVVSELTELAGLFADVARLNCEGEKTAWLQINYGKVLGVVKSVLGKFLNVFQQSGVLKEVMETVQKEMLDGELLKDCIEIGSNDLNGLVLIIKDLISQYFSTYSHDDL